MMGGLASLIIDLHSMGYTVKFRPDAIPGGTIITLEKEDYSGIHSQTLVLSSNSIEFYKEDINSLMSKVIMNMVERLEDYIATSGFTRTTLYEKSGGGE